MCFTCCQQYNSDQNVNKPQNTLSEVEASYVTAFPFHFLVFQKDCTNGKQQKILLLYKFMIDVKGYEK